MAISGTGLAAILAGSVFMYAGIKGKTVLGTVQAVVSGKDPKTAQPGNPITAPAEPSGGASSGGTPPGSSVPSPKSGVWTHEALMRLWESAGGSASTANNAACHAIQESGGNAAVTSSNPDGGTNVGLWQLDTPGGVGHGYSVAQLQHPAINAMITVRATKNGRDWSSWATPGC
jgi:hypothetical protein